jgi:branched-subunit amino acid ABC-type transport system permease component
MDQFLLFALLGLGSGAIYASVALGLVLMHRSSGVINFAHGALAMYAIYVYLALRDLGELILPVPGVPAIEVGDPMAFAPAFGLSVGLTALLGAVAYVLVFRPLERAPVLAQIVATVGLLLAITGMIQVHFPSKAAGPDFVAQVLPTDIVTIGGASVQEDRFWLTGLVILAAAALWALYRFTRFGLVTRAAAGSSKGAVLVGRDPRSVALGNWVLASVVAAVFGVLVAPLIPLTPDSAILLVVPSLAAAMLAGFRSFWIACFAGLALGVAQSELVSVQTNHPSLPQGLQTIAPLIVIIAVAFLRGWGTVRRDDLAQDRLPPSPTPRNVPRSAAIGLILGVAALTVTSGDLRLAVIVSLMASIVCLSIVLLTGYVGQISLMQVTFAGVSGLLLSALAASAGIPFPLAPLIAALAAAALGLALGVPSLRVRGTSLAVVTLSAAVATEQLVFVNSTLLGDLEGNSVTAPTILGVDFSILSGDYPNLVFGVFVLVIGVVVALAVANLRRSPSGVRMLAVRMNERAAASSGISVAQTKLVAFTLASLVAGLAGAVYAYQQVRISPTSFSVHVSLVFLATAYLGGITSVTGAWLAGVLIPGGVLLTLIDKLIELGDYESLVAGIAVMFFAVLNPNGLAGVLLELKRSRRSPRVPTAAAMATPRPGSPSHQA